MTFLLFLKTYWKWIVGALVIFFVIILGAALYSHLKKTPTIDQTQVNKINSANEKERKAELEKVINENLDVIKSTESDRILTDATVDERNRQVAEKIAEADKKVIEAKNQGRDITQEELECMLVPENCK